MYAGSPAGNQKPHVQHIKRRLLQKTRHRASESTSAGVENEIISCTKNASGRVLGRTRSKRRFLKCRMVRVVHVLRYEAWFASTS